ncbi:MAG: hypothetical protein QXK47_00105 [Candidatus Bathyarchaeia archaeon]
MLQGESRLVIYKTKYRNKTYDKCLINIPASIFKDERFPFKSEEELKITIYPDEKVIILFSSDIWKELVNLSQELAKAYSKGIEIIDSDKSLSTLQKDVAKLVYDRIFKQELQKFLSTTIKEAIEHAKRGTKALNTN